MFINSRLLQYHNELKYLTIMRALVIVRSYRLSFKTCSYSFTL